MLKIGRIDYINTLPLFAPFLTGHFQMNGTIFHGTPTWLNHQLLEGKLDFATISSIEFLLNQHQYALIPGFGIAAREKVTSVLFYSKQELKNLDRKKIGLTTESASSIQLLKILCNSYWGVTPEFHSMIDPEGYKNFDAFLQIGDKALLNPSYQGFCTFDLAEEWNRATGLGFTFGVFAIRNEALLSKEKEILEFYTFLQEALTWSQNHPQILLDLAKQRCKLPASVIEEYFKLIRYELQMPEMEGLKTFSQLSGIPYSPEFLQTKACHV
jgi:chorismate dehydratase